MKKEKIYISLYILVPLIYTGISIIGVIVTYQLFYHKENVGGISTPNLIYIMIAMGLMTLSVSFFLFHLLFKPLIKFVNKAQKMAIIAKPQSSEPGNIIYDVTQINEFFDNVTNILSKVEARELFPEIVGSSTSMRNIFTQILKVAATDSTVIICGESGTGKELIASSIYKNSVRRGKPFVKINCVAVPEGLLESEFFGHEKGSFTGAIEQKKGKFEIADGGIVFLDEIGDMPLSTQAKLLRVLQEKEFERVGGTKTIKVDIRFIAATNKNLSEMIKKGTFREDLYFRLNVFSINIPALRDRKEDILLLVNYFLGALPKHLKLTAKAQQELIKYAWPGNVRELKNVLEQASILSENGVIESHHLPALSSGNKSDKDNLNDDTSVDDKLNLMEREIIIEALRKTGGSQVKAANILGINQRSLWHRIKKLQIDVRNIKNRQ